jgi:acid phosphatase
VLSRRARTILTGVVVLTGIVVAALATGCSSSPPAGLPAVAPVAIPTLPATTNAHVTKVLTIVEENHSLQQMQTSMPFLSTLATQSRIASLIV